MDNYRSFWLAIVLCLPACKKEPPTTFQNLYLEVPLTLRPARDTMAVGDTLWLEGNYSDSLREIRSGRRFRLRPQDARPRVFVSFMQLTGQPERQRNFASAFEVLNRVGRIANLQQTAGLFEPAYQDGRYRIQIGLRAVKPGIASIDVGLSTDRTNPFGPESNMTSFIDLGQDANGKKIVPVLGNIYYVINEGKANNFHLLQQHSKVFSLDPNVPEANVYYEQKSTFNVVIK